MSNNLYIVLAFCVGQVPGGGSPYAPLGGGSPYSPSYQPAAYQQTVQPAPNNQPRPAFQSVPYNQPRPAAGGPVRSWLQNNFSSQKGKADCGCASQGRVPAVSSYGPVYIAPRAGTANPPQSGRYYPVQQGPAVPVVTESAVGIYEESIAPMPPRNQPPVSYQYEEGGHYQEQYLQPGQEAAIETHGQQPVAFALQVAKKYEHQIGHEEDYSWITGHLFFVHADGGRWVVRYALPGEIDKFGGSVVLAPSVEMKNFREGDLVCIYGEVLDEGRTSRSLGGALYRVNSILMIERADP